jgi:hypothetical protein
VDGPDKPGVDDVADLPSGLSGPGIAGLLVWALAHLGTAVLLARAGARLAALFVGIAGVAWALALLGPVRATAVVLAVVATPAAMLVVALSVGLGARAVPLLWGPVSLAAAGASLLLLSRADDPGGGPWQQLWVADHALWLVGTAWVLLRPAPRHVR